MRQMSESFVFTGEINRLWFSPVVLAAMRWLLGFEGSWYERMSPSCRNLLGWDKV